MNSIHLRLKPLSLHWLVTVFVLRWPCVIEGSLTFSYSLTHACNISSSFCGGRQLLYRVDILGGWALVSTSASAVTATKLPSVTGGTSTCTQGPQTSLISCLAWLNNRKKSPWSWSLLCSAFSSLEQTLCSHVILHEWLAFCSVFMNIHQSGVLTALTWLVPCEIAAIPARCVYPTQ